MTKVEKYDRKYSLKSKVNKSSDNNKKKTILIITIFILILLIIGISYAAYDYSFVGKESKLESGSASIKFLESNTNVIDIRNVFPVPDSNGKKGESFDFAVTTKANYDINLKYTLRVEKISVDSGYTSLRDNEVKVYLTDYDNKQVVRPTLISDLNNNILYEKVNSHSKANTSIIDKYKIRVWVNNDVGASSWDENTKLEYKFKIGIKSEEVEVVQPNAPVLDYGMIPVYYDETSETWKKADESNSNKKYKWYDYDNKMWANSVTVSSTNRSTYQSAEAGITIPMDDILTMQVWIPRYKYKVWNYNADGTVGSNEQEIEIAFEKGTAKTGEIVCQDAISGTDGDPSETCKLKATNSTCTDATCNNKTYTHPAFTFGDEEIKGFWVGKFELTGTIDNITTKPDLKSLRSQSVSTFETNIMNMKNSNNSYGFITTIDTHMIKNSEWGAVEYLSHSKYGTCTNAICKEVNINNSSSYYTGRSGGSSGGSTVINTVYTDQTSTTQYNAYGFYTYDGYLLDYNTNTKSTTKDMSKVASTTNNIYGIYGMSGGAYEYTMANVVSSDETTMISGSDSSYNSGYTGKIYDSGNYTSYTGKAYPDSKYYDKYSFSRSAASRKRSKLGDGIKEVYKSGSIGWHSDYSYLANSNFPWFICGGSYNNGISAGVFYSNGSNGNISSDSSSRLIITP